MKEKQIDVLDIISDLTNEETFDQTVRNSLHCLIPSRRRGIVLGIYFIVMLVIFNISPPKEYVVLSNELFDLVIPIVLALLTIVFTGYALFQAFAVKSTLQIILLNPSRNEKSVFADMNHSFIVLFLAYLTILIFTMFTKVIFLLMPISFQLPFFTNKTNEFLCSIALTIYLTLLLHSFIEIKSFVYSLYQCLKINVCSVMLENK